MPYAVKYVPDRNRWLVIDEDDPDNELATSQSERNARRIVYALNSLNASSEMRILLAEEARARALYEHSAADFRDAVIRADNDKLMLNHVEDQIRKLRERVVRSGGTLS